jgi:orotate phosphoribosyltransferase
MMTMQKPTDWTDIKRAHMELLTEQVREHALEMAPAGKPFKLKSGAESMFYLDCRNLHLTPAGLQEVVNQLWHRMQPMEFDAFGGPSIGADPIIGGLTYLSGMSPRGRKLRGFLVRKDEKEHGKAGRIVGPIKPGQRCIVIEDVTTTGGSAMDAVECVQAFGAQVVQVFSVVDRLAGGAALFASKGIPFASLMTIKDLGL